MGQTPGGRPAQRDDDGGELHSARGDRVARGPERGCAGRPLLSAGGTAAAVTDKRGASESKRAEGAAAQQ